MENFDFPSFAKYEVILGAGFNKFANGMPCILGVDEAGRGPVLGPMVYGLGVIPEKNQNLLKELKVDDSKALTDTKRRQIFDKMNNDDSIKKYFTYRLHVISPRMISCKMMMNEKGILNEISHSSCIDLIKAAIDSGINVKAVYVDTVGPKDKYQKKLQDIFKNIQIVVSEKADSKYPIVSAASIAAKVTRDNKIANWDYVEGSKYCCKITGSGYPGDMKTKQYLIDNCDKVFGFTSLVRFSWDTAESYIEKNCYKVNWDPYNINKTKEKTGVKRPAVTLLNYFAKVRKCV
ncbi:Ribonuclease H2 subunit A [Strongyloides ratti]|uniref:Ribonuclease n=1 Tax=Strongyloides ratti TaxID=34506 RepID=A0A090LE72_STRRB|nr:Ribonuclease H2 subunit A [Strongyloides ratti]CEF66443.1 Ribonuclease H2 subunit A [Strongyloides ratti]